MSITLADVGSGYNLSVLNSNFDTIEDYLNNSVMIRTGDTAGETLMMRDLDMNGFSILNAKIDGFDLNNFTEELKRAIRVPQTEPYLDPLLPAADRKGKVLGFDPDDGLPTVYIPASGSAADVLMMLAASNGDTLVGHGAGTVKDALDALEGSIGGLNGLTNADGFKLIGKFLNITQLRAFAPVTVGDIVYVASANSTSTSEEHLGGGYFQAVPLVGTDDGGINIQPATGTLMWKRIGYSDLEFVFWGVKVNDGLDYSAQILKAMTYVRSKQCSIKFPRGVVTSNETLPIWSNSRIVGEGREVCQFVKLTNNPFTVSPGVTIDALCACLPDVYNPGGFTLDTFCTRPQIEGISLRRANVTLANSSTYGIWGHKIASAKFSDMLVLGAQYGFYGINCFLMIQEQVSYSGSVGSYAGVFIANTLSGSYGRSGTTCLFTQVGVGGYNFGFFIAGLDSTKLVQCDTEALSRAAGESRAVAYNWINPMNCGMDNCYTENVDGVMLVATSSAPVSIVNSLVVNGFNITPGNTFTQSTPLMDIESAGVGAMNVTFIGGDLRNAAEGTGNMAAPIAAGAACVVKLLGAVANTWNVSGGAVVTTL